MKMALLRKTVLMKPSTLYLRAAIVLALAMVILAACQKKIVSDIDLPANQIAPTGFDFATEKKVNLNITLLTNDDKPLRAVPVAIYLFKGNELSRAVFNGLADQTGKLNGAIKVPAGTDSLIIDPVYPGLLRRAKAYIQNGNLTAVIGGSEGFSGAIVGSMNEQLARQENTIRSNGTSGSTPSVFRSLATSYSYLTKFDKDGRPTERATSDVISAEMLESVNASLPERDVREHHPQYLSNNAERNLIIEKDADVWVTFVSEGAGYRNSIGFYTYPTGNPPKTAADISKIDFVFPNASLKGSSGNMISGDKVKLGTFKAGTTIAFALFANAWDGKDVDTRATAYYTNEDFNPERTAELRRHTVLLKYDNRFLIGFEDLNRETESDHDFNDAIIYATSNPIEAISNTGVVPAAKTNDADGDGVLDDVDLFPNDPQRAYISYYPSKTSYATLAFEDQWPGTGDYDLNDLVINYQYAWVTNASNQVVELSGNFVPVANGASYANGFGVQFPFAPSAVSSVTGQRINGTYIKMSANGTETGQANAVIIPFDNCRTLLSNPGGAFFVNTDMAKAKVTGDTAKVKVTFASPLALSSFGTAPFNPFLISDQKRGYEVHLPMQRPTSLADLTLFGKGLDGSVPNSNIYYVTKENYPWALNFTIPFTYPAEKNSIADAYPNFLKWATSGGLLFTDWYSSLLSGYRLNNLLYTK